MLNPKSYEEVKESSVNAEVRKGYIARSEDVSDVTFKLPSEREFGDGFTFVGVGKVKIKIKAPKGFVIAWNETRTQRGGYIESVDENPYISLVSWQRLPDDNKKKVWNVCFMEGAWDFEIDGRRRKRNEIVIQV